MQKFHIRPRVYFCVLYGSQEMTIISPYSIHLLGLITETWHCLQEGPTLCTYTVKPYLNSQAKFRRVSVAATTMIREDNTTNQKTPLIEGVYLLRPPFNTELFMSHLPRMNCVFWSVVLSALMMVVAATETCQEFCLTKYVHSVGPICRK